MSRLRRITTVLLGLMLASTLSAEQLGLYSILAKPILGPGQPRIEVQAYTAARVPPLPAFQSLAEWEKYARQIRERTFNEVIFRGEAARWRDAKTRVEWLGEIPGGEGYRIKKVRFEAIPGLWIPALLYEPENLSGKVPVVLNVNGHDRAGKAAAYKQIRCINLAKRGMLALNVEWLGMGQLAQPGFRHYRLNQLDLCGTSGVALFYLSMKRSIDLLLDHQQADADRLAVTGLSGGGWQTIFISSLDERVRLANPVAGYSSFVTRAQFPEMDLGDSEQTPSDLAAVADYTHLTALRAPRPTLLTYNARDDCCFRADYALAPLLQAVRPVYALYDQQRHLRHHVNHDAGHNFGQDNREAFYRAVRDFFHPGAPDFPIEEISSDGEVKQAEELKVELPADNVDFHQIARELSRRLPRDPSLPADRASAAEWQRAGRSRLREIVRMKDFRVEAKRISSQSHEGSSVVYWQLKMDNTWTVPAVELLPAQPQSTIVLLADGGRKTVASEAGRLLREGRRVVAVDPFYFGESAIDTTDFLFALLVAALGERPLGIQASQVTAVARWLQERNAGPVTVAAFGPRTSVSALIAAAVEPEAIAGVHLHESFGSLREVIERDLAANETPELFCFGLLEAFDVPQLAAMVAPRPASFEHLSETAGAGLRNLKRLYAILGSSFDPLGAR